MYIDPRSSLQGACNEADQVDKSTHENTNYWIATHALHARKDDRESFLSDKCSWSNIFSDCTKPMHFVKRLCEQNFPVQCKLILDRLREELCSVAIQ